MGIQVFGRPKCFDTRKAERFFKERKVKYQYIDLNVYDLSPREFESILKAVGGPDKLVNDKSRSPEYDVYRYLSSEKDREDKLWEHPELIRTPIVRNGREATVGDQPEKWKTWL